MVTPLGLDADGGGKQVAAVCHTTNEAGRSVSMPSFPFNAQDGVLVAHLLRDWHTNATHHQNCHLSAGFKRRKRAASRAPFGAATYCIYPIGVCVNTERREPVEITQRTSLIRPAVADLLRVLK